MRATRMHIGGSARLAQSSMATQREWVAACAADVGGYLPGPRAAQATAGEGRPAAIIPIPGGPEGHPATQGDTAQGNTCLT
jgi:hypothetical protein